MLMNSTLTQIFVILTIFILCFLSKYFYTKAKEKEINIENIWDATYKTSGTMMFDFFNTAAPYTAKWSWLGEYLLKVIGDKVLLLLIAYIYSLF